MRKSPVCVLGILFLVGLALAVEPPPVKEGLWSVRTQMTNQPSNAKTDFTFKLCRNHAYDQYALGLAKNNKGCKLGFEDLSGGTYTLDSECNMGGSVLKSKTTITFQGDTASHSETQGTYTPALHGMTGSTVIQDQRYLGACPAGAQPGDRINADGSIMHLWRH
jgi:hypothetical protein